MRTCLVVLGDREQPSSPGSTIVHHRVDDLAALPDRVAQQQDRPTHVLVVGERRHASLVGRACSMVSAVTGVPVAGRALPHGPLAVRRLAEHAGSLVLPPAHVVAALDGAAAGTFSAAWVPGVARLSSPTPSLWQHLRSWFPAGAGFLVEHAPRELVTAVGGPADTDPPTDAPTGTAATSGPAERSVLAVAGAGLPEAALLRAQQLAGTRERVDLPPSPDAEGRYGTAAAVELVALPAAALVLPDADSVPACRVCGAPVLQPACPFCRSSTAPIPLEIRS